MKLISFLNAEGASRLGAITADDVVRDVTEIAVGAAITHLSPMRHFLTNSGDFEALAKGAASSPQAMIAAVLPVIADPTKVVAAPVNYRDHQQEMTSSSAVDSLGVFLKAPSSVIGDGGTVQLPYIDRRFDQEGELAVVIGRSASHVALEDALSYVAGYTCLLDITMRGGEDCSLRKSFDTFTPIGPHLVTPDEVGPVDELELRTWVNGVLRQRADLADLIWDVPRLICYISSVMVLNPGDVIATGTPAGVGQIRAGEHVTVQISNIGRLNVSVGDVGAVSCPTRGVGHGPVPPAEVTPPAERPAGKRNVGRYD